MESMHVSWDSSRAGGRWGMCVEWEGPQILFQDGHSSGWRVDAGCWLGAELGQRAWGLGSYSRNQGRTNHSSWVLINHHPKTTRWKAKMSCLCQPWEAHGITSPLHYWSGQVEGQGRVPEVWRCVSKLSHPVRSLWYTLNCDLSMKDLDHLLIGWGCTATHNYVAWLESIWAH